MSKPKYEVGDSVIIDVGWERVVPRKVVISEVRAHHGRQDAHRYWGNGDGGSHGFYEDQILVEGRDQVPQAAWEAPCDLDGQELSVKPACPVVTQGRFETMTTWPADNKPANFAHIVEPLARWFRMYQEGRMEIYDGLPLGRREAAGSLQPVDALTPNSLAYNLTDQGRDVLDVILSLAVQLGIEQGRRLPVG